MSAKAPAAPAADAPVAAGPSKLPMILLGAMVVGNLGGTAVIALRLLSTPPAKAEAASHEGKKAKAEEGPGPVVSVDTFVVNLNEPGSSRYLKTTFELEVENAIVQKEVEEHRRALRDDVLRYLSNLTVKETMGEAAKAKIKEDLLSRADKLVGSEHKVKNLFFTEFVVQ